MAENGPELDDLDDTVELCPECGEPDDECECDDSDEEEELCPDCDCVVSECECEEDPEDEEEEDD